MICNFDLTVSLGLHVLTSSARRLGHPSVYLPVKNSSTLFIEQAIKHLWFRPPVVRAGFRQRIFFLRRHVASSDGRFENSKTRSTRVYKTSRKSTEHRCIFRFRRANETGSEIGNRFTATVSSASVFFPVVETVPGVCA